MQGKKGLKQYIAEPMRHYSRVLMQQGRVQLDADWNEQTEILLHYLRTLACDIIGPHAGPLGALGFDILTGDTADAKAIGVGLDDGRTGGRREPFAAITVVGRQCIEIDGNERAHGTPPGARPRWCWAVLRRHPLPL